MRNSLGLSISECGDPAARRIWSLRIVTWAALALVLVPTVTYAGEVKLAWDANTESDLAGYKVYYGNASGTYQSTIDVGNVTSYTVTGLQDGLLYFFAVTAYSTSAAESGFSNEVSTTVVSVPDTTPPVVSAVTVPVKTFSGATIIWTTNEASNSQVDYGLTTAYGSVSPLDAVLTSAHSVTLGGLSGNTLYHYRVRSRDAAGNLAVSADSTFSTLAVDLPPANLVAAYSYNEGSGTTAADVSVNNNPASLSGATWSTACKFGNCLSFNGTTSFVESPDIVALTPGADATFEAWISLSAAPTEAVASVLNKWSQTTDDEYLFGVSSAQEVYFAWHTTGGNIWPSPSFNHAFSTGTIPLNTLTHIAVVRSGATLRFYINGNLDSTLSVIDTNPFPNGINTLRMGGQGRGASRFFNGRIDEPRIYNRALTQAEIQYDMNTAIPSVTADTTPPVISSVAVPVRTTSGATITWTTNEPADSQVQYGLTTAYGGSTTQGALVTAHSVTITGLADGTLYHFRVRSRDATGNVAFSADSTFTTLDGTAPSVSITAPVAGATVSGAVTVTASAADNVGVTQVQILVDGLVVATDTTAPYGTAWDSSTVANGAHSVTAVARDLAGNSRTSAAVSVVVANDDEVIMGLGTFPADGGWLALGGKQANAFATQIWARIGWDAYNATNGELHSAAGDLDGDGLDEIVVGFGTGGNGWIAILDDPAHGYQWLRWIQVAWPSYNAANGAVFPAVGDLDGDGRAEIVAGLGAGSGGFIEIFDDAANGYAHVRWLEIPWTAYNAASGETHPSVGDVDGDGRAEIIIGLGTGGQGFVEVRGSAPNYDHRTWLQVASVQYNQLNGATFPAAGDIDGDGRAEVVVGLGQGGGGWIQLFDDALVNHAHLRWLQVAWTAYNSAAGEAHPAVGNLDNDAAAEIVIGLGRFTGGPGGWFEVLDDANTGTGYEWLGWHRVGRDAFEQSGGATYPAVAQQRR